MVPLSRDAFSEQVIECKLNIYRGAFISPEEFRRYFNHFRENIRQIWTTDDAYDHPSVTFRNKGTAATNHRLMHPDYSWPICISTYATKYTDDNIEVQLTKGVEFELGVARHFGKLEDKEIIVYVNRQTNPRSFTLGNRRGMSMAFEEQPANTNYADITSRNVPAHEFGHVLGLADRYTYLGLAQLPVSNINAAPLNTGQLSSLFRMNPNYGRSPYLYLPESYDEDYSTRYAWMHNLMSSQTRTPDASEIFTFNAIDIGPTSGLPKDGTLVFYEKDYRTEYDVAELRPENLTGGGRVPAVYQKVSIFITQKQWEIIFANGNEAHDNVEYFRFANHVFIKDAGGLQYPGEANRFKGSLVGKDVFLFPGADNDSLISDDRYNYYVDSANPSVSQLDINGKMKWRVRKWGSGTSYPTPLASTENLQILQAHIGILDETSNPLNGSTFGYSDSALDFRKTLERGEVGSDAITDAINERRKFFIDRLKGVSNPIDRTNFNVKIVNVNVNNITLEPIAHLNIHIMNRRFFQFGLGVVQADAYENTGNSGGAKFKLPIHLGTITAYVNGLTPTNLPITTNDIADGGRLIWNKSTPISTVTGETFHFKQYRATALGIWREAPDNYPLFPKDLINPTLPSGGASVLPESETTFIVKWQIYTNRNIILYLLENGRINFTGDNGYAFFRNHRGIDYKRALDPTLLMFVDDNGFNWY